MQLLTTHPLMPCQSPGSNHCPLYNSPQAFLFIVEWNIHLASLGQLFCLCRLPASCAPPASSLVGNYKKLKSPWLGVSTAQQQLTLQCVINIILILYPKHSTIPVTRRKINSILADIGQEFKCILLLQVLPEHKKHYAACCSFDNTVITFVWSLQKTFPWRCSNFIVFLRLQCGSKSLQ